MFRQFGSLNVLMCTLGVFLVTMVEPQVSLAQITPETGQDAFVDEAFNGQPDILNIAPPSAGGLSHNKFLDFNVRNEGLVINNANQATTSSLAGAVIANPNLAGNAGATLILNEVTSGNVSQINGFQELVGRRAEYILANPNGVTCNGCGFINFPRATFTTGTPNINASSLVGFTVNQGQVTITGNGLNAGTDIFDIVARNVLIEGQINADDLGITAGDNVFDYATRTGTSQGLGGAPTLAIDSTVVGGIFADRIRLISTEAGAGVRMRSDVAASVNDLTIDANGVLTFENTANVSAQTNVSVTGVNEVEFAGASVFAGNDLSVRVNRSGVVIEEITLRDGASLGANRDVDISGAARLETTGLNNEIFAGRNADITVDDTLVGTAGELLAGNLQLEADNNLDITVDGSITLSGNSAFTGNASAFRTGTVGTGRLNITTTDFTGGNITANAGTSLASGNTLDITTPALRNITLSGVTDALSDITITSNALTNNGDFVSGRDITLNVTEITNTDRLSADRDLTIGSNGFLSNTNGSILSANRNLSITSTETSPATLGVFNDGTFFAGSALDVVFGGTSVFENNGGSVFARDNILIGAATPGTISGQEVLNISGSIESLNGNVTINADTISNEQPTASQPAQILAGNNININFTTSLDNEASLISAANNINIDGNPDGDMTDGDLTNDDPNTIQGAVIEAVNNVNIINVSQVNNGTIGTDAGAGTTVDQTNPSTLSGLTLPTDPNGVFVVTQNPDANFLIEANPAFGLNALFGSDYLLIRLGHDPDEFRRLGDNNFELQLLRQQLIEQFGLRFIIEDASSEDDQFRILLENASNVAEDLELTIGVALTSDQIKNLSKDIVWLVEKVVDGQNVLVPQVYLSVATLNRIANGTQSTIAAGNNLDIAAQNIQNITGSLRAGQDLALNAQQNIINLGGQITAGNNIDLTAVEGNIVNESLINVTQTQETETGSWGGFGGWFGNFFGGELETVTTTTQDHMMAQAGISAGGNIQLEAGQDIKIKGAIVDSGQNLALNAGGNVNVSSLALNKTVNKETGSDTAFGFLSGDSSTAHSVDYIESLVKAGGNILLNAEDSIENNRSTLDAGNNLTLLAENNIQNINGRIRAGTNADDNTQGRLIALAREGQIINKATGRHDQASIEALGDAYLIAKGDIENRGALIGAGEDILIQSQEGSILNTTNKYRVGSSRNWDDVRGNTGTIQSGGNTTLVAKQDVDVIGADVKAGEKLTIVAQDGDVNLESQELKSKRTTKETYYVEEGWWIFKKKKKRTRDIVTYSDEEVFSNIEGGDGVTIAAGDDINQVGADVLGGTGDIAYIASDDINITGVLEEETTTTTESESESILGIETSGRNKTNTVVDQNWRSSTVSTEGNIFMQSGGDTNIVGSDVSAGEDIVLNADGSISIKAVKERDSSDTEENSHGFYAESGTSGASAQASVGHQWNSETENIVDETIVRSGLTAGRNVSMTSGEDINIQSSDIVGGTGISLDAERDINLTALAENDSYSSSSSSDRSGFQANADLDKSDAGYYHENAEGGLDINSKVHDTTSLISGGNINIRAGRDVTEQSANVTAGGNIGVGAGRDFISEAVVDTLTITKTGTTRRGDLGIGIKTGLEGSAEDVASLFGAEDEIDRGEGQTATLNDPGLNAGINAEYSQQQFTDTFEQGTARRSNWASGGNLSINAGRDVKMEGTEVDAGGNLSLSAGRNVELIAARDYVKTSRADEVFGGEAIGDPIFGTNAAATGGYLGTTETEESTTAQAVKLKSGGNMTLSAENDITLEGTQAESGGNMALDAGNDLNITAARDTYKRTKDTLNIQGGADYSAATGGGGKVKVTYESDLEEGTTAQVGNFKSRGNLSLNAGNDANLEGTNIEAGGDVNLSAGNDVNYTAAEDTYNRERTYVDTLVSLRKAKGGPANNFREKLGKANNKYNQNVQVNVETENTNITTRKGGTIKSGGNLNINAGRDVNLEGTKASDVGGDIAVGAGRDINLKAAKSTVNSNQTNVGAGVGLQGTGFDVGNLQYDATTYDGTALVTDGNITLRSGRDTSLEGSVVTGDSVDANIGHNLNIQALVNEERIQGGGAGLGAGLTGIGGEQATATAPEGFGGTFQDVQTAGILGRDRLNVDVNGNTDLQGGRLTTNQGGDLSVTTGSLSASDVVANTEYGSITTWGTTSSETARATIGEGNLTVRDGNGDAVNRDASSYLTGTQDENSTFVGDVNEGRNKLREIRDTVTKKQGRISEQRDELAETAKNKTSSVNGKIELASAQSLTAAVKKNVNNVVKTFGNNPERVPATIQKSLLQRAGVTLPEGATNQAIQEAFTNLVKKTK